MMTSQTPLAIQVEQVSKVYRTSIKKPGLSGAIQSVFQPRYTEKTAVNQLSFEIQAGEAVGFIGVNGAGKSTTIKMLTGVLLPSGGRIRVFGLDPYADRLKNARQISAVFGQRTQLWWDLALVESLNLIGRIYQIPKDRYQTRFAELTEQLDLGELLHVSIRNMSLGQRMRAELAAALLHDPKILFLDEPTIGLDLIVKERIREVIKKLNESQHTTLFLTTHDLSDIEELCQRVIIIDKGAKVYDGHLSFIKEQFGKHRNMTFEGQAIPTHLTLPEHTEVIEQTEHKITLRFDRHRMTASQVTAHMITQMDIRDFSLVEPALYSIIKQIYETSQ